LILTLKSRNGRRGRYDSEGTFELLSTEAADGFDADAWVAREPSSNGEVAGLGRSYYGLTQSPQATRRIRPS
jgi:predicted acyl esterase